MIAEVFLDGVHVRSDIEPDRIPRQGETVHTAEGAEYTVVKVSRLWVPDHGRFGNQVKIYLTKIARGDDEWDI